jgi:lipid II:glycine glycyltransferase (peptidoglycan interpeptide bridge formation enzyme)
MQSLGWAATLEAVGWSVVVCGRAFAAVNATPRGVYIRFQRPAQLDLAAIAELRARSGAYRIFVEPSHDLEVCHLDGQRTRARFDRQAPGAFLGPLEAAGWEVSRETIGPSKTRVVSLEPSPEALLASFSPSQRRNVRHAVERHPTRFEVVPFDALDPVTIGEVERCYRDAMAFNPNIGDDWNFRCALKQSFGPGGDLILARVDGAVEGVAYLLRHDRVATFYAAFCSRAGRALDVPSGVVWTAMRHARALGCDLFDFYGVHDERSPERNVSYKGFTDFKARFGGASIYFPPSLDVVPTAPDASAD